VSALGCFYLRLIGKPEDIYNYLEPLYNDYRKLRYRETDGSKCIKKEKNCNRIIEYKLIHVDEFIDELLLKEALCDTVLPRLVKRQNLEDLGSLQLRHSVLEDLEEDDETLLAEIKENGENEPKGITAGDDELIENPRAAALKPDRSSEEKSPKRKHRDRDEEEEEERKRKKDKKRHKKEKKSNRIIDVKKS
jgi:pre-mRNA-splicing factor 38A